MSTALATKPKASKVIEPELSGSLSVELRRVIKAAATALGGTTYLHIEAGRVLIASGMKGGYNATADRVLIEAPITGKGSLTVPSSARAMFFSAKSVTFDKDVVVTDDVRWNTAKAYDLNPVGTLIGDAVTFGPSDIAKIGRLLTSCLTDDVRAPQLMHPWATLVDDQTIGFGTDSYRLHRVPLDAAIKGETTIPYVGARLAIALGGTSLSVQRVDENIMRFVVKGAVECSGEVHAKGPHPDAEKLTKTPTTHTLTFNRSDLASIARKAQTIMGTGNYSYASSPLRLIPSAVGLKTSLQVYQVCEWDATIDAEGDASDTVAFNPAYLADCMRTLTGDKVTWKWADETHPTEFRGDDDMTTYLMPVRISSYS